MSDVVKPFEVDKAFETAQKQKEANDAAARIKDANDCAPPNQDVLAEAQAGIDEHRDDLTKAQGRAAERAALVKMQPDGKVTDLNQQLGANFPIYDVASDKQIASVKCKGLETSSLIDSARDAYIRDFEEAIGQGTRPEKFANAARYLHEAAAVRGSGLPPELAVSPQSAEKYLRENAKLIVPDDHAVVVKNELAQRLFSADAIDREVAARRVGLDPAMPNYQSEANILLGRVEGIGIRSTEIKNLLNHTPGVWKNV